MISIVMFTVLLDSFGSAAVPSSAQQAHRETCIALDSPVIVAGQLAPFIPELQGLPPTLKFGFAPDIGLRRVLGADALNRFLLAGQRSPRGATKNANAIQGGVCIVRKSRTLSASDAIPAIRAAFPERQLEIDLIEISKRAVATLGSLHFSRSDLPQALSPATVFTWNGWYLEPDGRKRPIWVRVRLKEKALRVVAKKDLAIGEILTPDNVGLEERESFPTVEPDDIHEVWGKAPREPILAGTILPSKRLVRTPAIRKGDPVLLEAVTALTRLSIPGKAESTAFKGQRVMVTTALSKKAIQATATGNGRAEAQSPATGSAAVAGSTIRHP